MIGDVMQLFQVDDLGRLFISPAISDWRVIEAHKIDTIIDLDAGIDRDVPTVPNQCLYLYFPIFDEQLPDLHKLHAVAALGRRSSAMDTGCCRTAAWDTTGPLWLRASSSIALVCLDQRSSRVSVSAVRGPSSTTASRSTWDR